MQTAESQIPSGERQAALTLEIDGDGVAWFIFDRPASKVNLLTEAVMMRLDELVARVESEARSGGVRGAVFRSEKDSFIAGADVDEIASITDPAEGTRKAAAGQSVFRRIEALPVPTVAAIDGACMGGGTELALACSHRIASDRPGTRIALPEVRLGILPAFGGTVRLPRLIGLRAALDLILTGRSVDARRAERIGLVDERVPAAILVRRAGEAALMDPAELRGRGRRRGIADRLLDGTPPGRALVLRQARRKVLAETRGHYPAPLEIIETVRATLTAPLDEAFPKETAALGRLVVTDTCKNLIHVFRLMEGARKAAPDAAREEVERIAILGAGVMGGGIAQLAAERGLEVRMKDIRAEALSQGLQTADELFQRSVRRRRMKRSEAEEAMRRISPTLEYSGFGSSDLLIEAVVERMDVKKKVLAEAEQRLKPTAVMTSNTSTLSITEMQGGLERPERFCGMHFFNPVHRMPLVEVIRGGASSDTAVATVFHAALKLGKTPLLVKDGPGFLVNRILGPYLNEAGWLLVEGAAIEAVDRALVDFGMPMGPFRLLDEVGLDVARHAGEVLSEAFGERMRPAPPLAALDATGRLGRKGGRGFYLFEDGREKEPDPEVYEELAEHLPEERTEPPADLIQDRCVLPMVNEAAYLLEEGIVTGAGDVDLGMITGTGFPPFRGGLLRYADARGIGVIIARLEELERLHGPRFAPSPYLRTLASTGATFYR